MKFFERHETMPSLPSTSVAGFTKGIWFVFPVGDHLVRAWGSCLTGLERIYIDDALVSERRSMRHKSSHDITLADTNYTVTFKIISRSRGQLECALNARGKVLRAYRTKLVRTKEPFSVVRAGLAAIIGLAFGFLGRFFELPKLLLILLLVVLVFVMRGKPRKKVWLSIVDVTSPQDLMTDGVIPERPTT